MLVGWPWVSQPLYRLSLDHSEVPTSILMVLALSASSNELTSTVSFMIDLLCLLLFILPLCVVVLDKHTSNFLMVLLAYTSDISYASVSKVTQLLLQYQILFGYFWMSSSLGIV